MNFESFVDAVVDASHLVENPRMYIENALYPFYSKRYMDDWGDNIVYSFKGTVVELTFLGDAFTSWGIVDEV